MPPEDDDQKLADEEAAEEARIVEENALSEEASARKAEDDALLAELAQEEAEFLDAKGLGQFKSYEQLIAGFKKEHENYETLNKSDRLVFPKVKELAKKYGMTPEQFIESIDNQLNKGGTPDKKVEIDKAHTEELMELKMGIGRAELDMRFLKFQRKMEKQEIEIPDEIQPELEKLLPKILYGKSAEELKGIDPFDEAHELYLFKISKVKDIDELSEKLDPHKKRLEAKRRQLGMPPGAKGKKVTQQEVEKQAIWGDTSKL